ncbi:MAG: ABC transporter substrate-binding protein [Phycisphaeraceae bacterium]|nr:ABC transporter substrate-binding protein [Phycisphaeraceae bacterium]
MTHRCSTPLAVWPAGSRSGVLAGLVMLAICACLAACGRSTPGAAPATGSAAAHAHGATAAEEEPRYVVLSPALAVMLRDLGHENRIVARHAYDLVLDEDLPVAGELGRIDYEVLIAARPTHVLVEWGNAGQALPERLESLARERHFEIMRFTLLTLADIRDAVDRLETALPSTDPAPPDGFWQDRMDAVWVDNRLDDTGLPRFERAGRILLVAATNPTIGVTGPGSWHHQIVEAIGGTPAIADGAPWMELSAEDVVRLAPDAILLIQPRGRDEPDAAPATPDEVLERLGVLARLDIPAIRNRRVALIDDSLAHTPSTAMVPLTDQIARILAAWSAPDARTGAN